MPVETALITGASSGIGRELAELFAADHANLVLVARRGDELERLARQLRSAYQVHVMVLTQDLTVAEGLDQLQEQLRQRDITVDVLANNAGFGATGHFADLSLERQLDMVRLNVVALTDLTRRFLPGMLQRGRGAVLNVASTAAFQPGPNMAVYFATKAYVLSLTEALAEEVRGTGVRVTCLCPGPTATEFGTVSGVDKTLLFRLGTMDARTVARHGIRALRRGRTIVIPGWISWLVAFSVRFTPRWMARRIGGWLMATDR